MRKLDEKPNVSFKPEMSNLELVAIETVIDNVVCNPEMPYIRSTGDSSLVLSWGGMGLAYNSTNGTPEKRFGCYHVTETVYFEYEGMNYFIEGFVITLNDMLIMLTTPEDNELGYAFFEIEESDFRYNEYL